MKKRLSWILVGTMVTAGVTYSTLCDPLDDLLSLSKQLEHASVSTLYDSLTQEFADCSQSTERQTSTLSDKTTGDRARLVRQQSGSRFGRESKDLKSKVYQKSHYSTRRAFRESIGSNYKSTVQVLENGQQVALGTVVSADGWIVTKASELPDSKVEVRLYDGSKADALIRTRRSDLDLALLKIERENLPVIQWGTDIDVPVGGWLASTGAENQLPVSIGVMSVVNRAIPRERPVLGVKLGTPPGKEPGAMVNEVVEGSGAWRAGIEVGDIIFRIDSDSLSTQEEVLRRLGSFSAGQFVNIGIRRDGDDETLKVQMMDLNHSLLDPTEMEVNGEISARSTGFQKVMQHDSVLAPNECGGPIVDVHGNAVGINIARAGRVSSYALSAKVVAPAVADMLASINGNASVVKASSVIPSSQVSSTLPSSVPTGITIETLKPEVFVPNPTRR